MRRRYASEQSSRVGYADHIKAENLQVFAADVSRPLMLFCLFHTYSEGNHNVAWKTITSSKENLMLHWSRVACYTDATCATFSLDAPDSVRCACCTPKAVSVTHAT